MDFFAYFDGTTIDSFSASGKRAAGQYINKRYTDSRGIVIVPVASTKEQFEKARKRSIELAKQ